MGSRLIGRLNAVYTPPGGWSVDKAERFRLRQLTEALAELAQGKPVAVRVTVERIPKPRSLNQNDMMWALLRILTDAQNGGRTGDYSVEDCYRDMLLRYGANYKILTVPKAAVEYLRRAEHCVTKVLEIVSEDLVTVQVVEGSSSFSTGEMKQFIDGIFDTLAELGVNDAEVTDYWRQWRADALPRSGVPPDG